MAAMEYHAINLGLRETEFLSKPNFEKFISANLVHGDSEEYVTAPYRLFNFNAMRIAVLGITAGIGTSSIPSIKVIQPDKALKAILPEINAKADFVILLSDYNAPTTQTLLEAEDFGTIDLVIANSHKMTKTVTKTDNGIFIITPTSGCSGLQTPIIQLAGNRIIDIQSNGVYLDHSVEMDPEILKITGHDDYEMFRNMEKKDMVIAKKQTIELSKMDPHEVISRLTGSRQENVTDKARLEKQLNLIKNNN